MVCVCCMLLTHIGVNWLRLIHHEVHCVRSHPHKYVLILKCVTLATCTPGVHSTPAFRTPKSETFGSAANSILVWKHRDRFLVWTGGNRRLLKTMTRTPTHLWGADSTSFAVTVSPAWEATILGVTCSVCSLSAYLQTESSSWSQIQHRPLHWWDANVFEAVLKRLWAPRLF